MRARRRAGMRAGSGANSATALKRAADAFATPVAAVTGIHHRDVLPLWCAGQTPLSGPQARRVRRRRAERVELADRMHAVSTWLAGCVAGLTRL
jgi:hypothetical protein